MEEGVTSTDVLAFQEQRRHETEKRKRVEEIAGKEDGRASKERVSKDRGANEEEKGIIANFISNLVPINRETADNEAQDDRMDRGGSGKGGCKLEEDLGGANGDGSIVSNLISGPTEAREREEEKGNEKEERVFDVKIEEEGGGGGGSGGGGGEGERGGIIETLVSHLPKTLPDDMAPPPEEASILIYSIVHD